MNFFNTLSGLYQKIASGDNHTKEGISIELPVLGSVSARECLCRTGESQLMNESQCFWSISLVFFRLRQVSMHIDASAFCSSFAPAIIAG